MPGTHENARLAAAAGASLVIHLITAWALTSATRPPDPSERRTPPPEPQTPLGIDRSDAATITWIGFQDPAPNHAAKSTVEQAAQQIGGGQPAQATQALRQLQRRSAQSARATLDAVIRALRDIDLSAPRQQSADASKASPQTEPAQRPQPEPAPGDPAPTRGNAEREADAFSIEDPVKIEWGKPVAAEGLEILTRKKGPDYSAFTRVSARPRPPLIEISFNDQGAVTFVEIMRSSGYDDVDRPLTDAIYTWRARGERIDNLAPGGTLAVRLRIIIR